MRKVALALIFSTCMSGGVAAQIVPPQNSKPEAYPKPIRVPAARDVPYPGTLQVTVDATDITRGIFKIHQTVPVKAAGDLVMLYPKWIPGGHSPRGDIKSVAGIHFTANGRALRWMRDPLDV